MCLGSGILGGLSYRSLSWVTNGYTTRAAVFVGSSHLIQSRLLLRITKKTTKVPDLDMLAYC
jgi:hypothetical protein